MEDHCDLLVIGAGPAGTIAGSIANKEGKKVIVVEKQVFPRFVIGESLLPTSMHHFEAAGFLDALENFGFEKKYGALFVRGDGTPEREDEVALFDFSQKFTKGWDYTYQAPRADFDKVMADELIKMGVPIHYNTEVTGVSFEGADSITSLLNSDGTTSSIRAKFLIDASGYGRVLPKLLSLDKPSNFPPKQATFAHMTDTHRYDERKEYGRPGVQITFYVLERELWLWVIPFSNNYTSLGLVGDPKYFEQNSTDSPQEVFMKYMSLRSEVIERFADQKFVLEPRTIMNYAISTEKMHGPGFSLAGNATEFLDPVFSSGVGFATESGYRAALLAVRQLNGENIDWEIEYEQHMRKGINVFRSYVEGWYNGDLQEIFFSPNENPEIKRNICAVLAGYVWDTENLYVKRHETALKTLANVIRMGKKVH